MGRSVDIWKCRNFRESCLTLTYLAVYVKVICLKYPEL
ncbi:hypothetical protein VPH184E373B_0160 [Vibrio phage 184E37-3b]